MLGKLQELRRATRGAVDALQPDRMPRPRFRNALLAQAAPYREVRDTYQALKASGKGKSGWRGIVDILTAADDTLTSFTEAATHRPSLRAAREAHREARLAHITGAMDAGERLGKALLGLFGR